ncbi:hypothetical protein ACO0M4_34340 [Streptomyces sp. RGM 3693]|uniref:hypothetical protein n=1 Tax=Streptomyces sp. RGM 3693 TaxID=3413284 RepID=UPI003D268885
MNSLRLATQARDLIQHALPREDEPPLGLRESDFGIGEVTYRLHNVIPDLLRNLLTHA